jgi:hypothetical protein
MYWSHANAEKYAEWLSELGFQILDRRRIPEGDSAHALFLARRAPA